VIATLASSDNKPKPDPPPATVKIGDAAFFEQDECLESVKAITYYRRAYRETRETLGLAGPVPRVWYQDCDVVRRRAGEWRDRAGEARQIVVDVNSNPTKAICYVFGPYCSQALSVSSCETGGTFHVGAQNGQYLGLFQMGSSERATYGHGSTALEQARAAYRYFVRSDRDWSPWSCKP